MTGRSFALGIVVTALVCTIGGRCTAPPPKGLPTKVQQTVNRHAASSAVDTTNVNRLEREKTTARQRELAVAAGRRRADSIATRETHRADSLAGVARVAQTSADSAAAWQAAYESRTREAAQLEISRDSARAETREAHLQLASADAQSAIWKAGKLRGDTVIAQLLPLAESAGDRCRILWLFGCPSRKAAAIGGAIAGAGVVYVGRKVAKGKIKVRLPIG